METEVGAIICLEVLDNDRQHYLNNALNYLVTQTLIANRLWCTFIDNSERQKNEQYFTIVVLLK